MTYYIKQDKKKTIFLKPSFTTSEMGSKTLVLLLLNKWK